LRRDRRVGPGTPVFLRLFELALGFPAAAGYPQVQAQAVVVAGQLPSVVRRVGKRGGHLLTACDGLAIDVFDFLATPSLAHAAAQPLLAAGPIRPVTFDVGEVNHELFLYGKGAAIELLRVPGLRYLPPVSDTSTTVGQANPVRGRIREVGDELLVDGDCRSQDFLGLSITAGPPEQVGQRTVGGGKF